MRYPELRIWTDTATDHPEMFRWEDEALPIRGATSGWESLTSLSKALGGLQEIRRFRVCADVRNDPSLKNEIQQFCRNIVA